jgi:hypothetical protein
MWQAFYILKNSYLHILKRSGRDFLLNFLERWKTLYAVEE